jgi:hypothetical protein
MPSNRNNPQPSAYFVPDFMLKKIFLGYDWFCNGLEAVALSLRESQLLTVLPENHNSFLNFWAKAFNLCSLLGALVSAPFWLAGKIIELVITPFFPQVHGKISGAFSKGTQILVNSVLATLTYPFIPSKICY